MDKKLKQFQQGDVLFQEIAGIPAEAVRVSRQDRIIVAKGEITGHTHAIKSDQAEMWALTRNGIKEVYLKILAPVTIVHDEHKPLEIPPGNYRVGRVKEYDYFADMERQIQD